MRIRILQEIAGFMLASAAVAAAILIRWLLDPVLGHELGLITLYAAVALTVWFAGLRYSIFATLAGYVVAALLFIDPRGHIVLDTPTTFVGFVLYLLSCGFIIVFGERFRRAERKRREADEQLQLSLGAGRIGTIDWDLRSGKIQASPEARRIFGTSQLGDFEQGLSLVHPEDRGRVRAAIEKSVVDGVPFAAEGRYIRPSDGEVLRLIGHGVVRLDRHGKPNRIIAAVTDQT